MNTIKFNSKNTKLIAHRGLSGIERENTICAFIAACNRNYFGNECDIHITKDNEFVVCHDNDTLRVSGVNLEIATSDYSFLKEIDLYEVNSTTPKSYLKIPKLSEFILLSKKYNKECIIELKPDFSINQIEKLLELVNSFDYLDKTIFISFKYENLRNIRLLNNSVRLQYLFSKFPEFYLDKLKSINADVDIHYSLLTKEVVSMFHQNSIKVNVWTVDDLNIANKLVEWNVDYITTNILEKIDESKI